MSDEILSFTTDLLLLFEFPRTSDDGKEPRRGIEAALSRGMFVVGIGPDPRVDKADLALPDLANIRVADVLNKLIE